MPLTKVKSLGTENIGSGNRNLIINGSMQLSQRYGTTSTAVTNATLHVLDRFKVNTTAGGGTSLNVQQVLGNPTNAPYGHSSSMKMTVATVDDGGSDSFNVVQTRIENFDTNHLAFGSSSAKTLTLSFHVKSSLTGTFGGALVSGNYSKGYVFQYTISSADTWEKKTITIVGDTSTTADSVYNRASATSANGLVLYFDLGSGSDFEKSSANSWSATGTYGYGARISGNVKLCANNGADWSITGIQLEEGSQASDFEHRSFAVEKRLCQRFYFQTEGKNFAGVATSTNRVTTGYRIPDMRATPSFTFISYNGTTARLSRATNNADTTFSSASVSSLNGFYQITSSSNTFTANDGYFAQLKCDAEL
tara:strand:+ start:1487 stop:2578 length:1092 start_codon:yes stop_codon:yes gene_type:complete